MPDQDPSRGPHAPTAHRQADPIRDSKRVSPTLEALVAQVLTQPPAAALPCNLTDEWLDLISRDLEVALGKDVPQDSDAKLLAPPLALVIHILEGQHNKAGDAWSFEELFDRLQDYRLELALELLNRRTGVRATPATMATIFLKQREIFFELATRPKDTDK